MKGVFVDSLVAIFVATSVATSVASSGVDDSVVNSADSDASACAEPDVLLSLECRVRAALTMGFFVA